MRRVYFISTLQPPSWAHLQHEFLICFCSFQFAPFPFDSKVCYTIHLSVKHPALLERPEQFGLQEFANCDVLCETLPSPCLKHEVACELLCGCGFERSGCDVFVERVAGDDGPAVKNEGEGDLALCVNLREVSISLGNGADCRRCTYPEIGLETERIDYRDKTTHVVQRSTRDGSIL